MAKSKTRDRAEWWREIRDQAAQIEQGEERLAAIRATGEPSADELIAHQELVRAYQKNVNEYYG